MKKTGYLIAQVFTARMAIPIPDVAVTIMTDTEGKTKLISFQKTDLNGKTQAIAMDTPDLEVTLEPSDQKGFTTCNVQLDHPEYYSVLVEHVQVFPEVESIQQMEMVPLEEFSAPDERSRIYVVTPQDL